MTRISSLRAFVPALGLALSAAAQEAAGPLPRGERLLGEFHCSACHEASPVVEARLAPQAAPGLEGVAGRVTPGYLARYLADPFGTNPMGRMPDVLAGLSDDEHAQAVDTLTHFLMGLGEPLDRTPTPAHLSAVERGRRVFHESGCVACHRPQEELWELDWTLAELFAESDDEGGEDPPEDDPDVLATFIPEGTLEHPDVPLELDWLAGKTTVHGLATFLMDPLAVRPSGRMPDLALTADEAFDVARYLLRGQTSLGEWRYEEAEGIGYEYFEEPFEQLPPDWDSFEAVESGSTGAFDIGVRKRGDHFGFRWEGMINVPEDGTYTFWTTSDDGSHLWVDGVHVVDNGGVHGNRTIEGSIELDQGRHALLVTHFERGGGESMTVEFAGPTFERGPIPPEILSHAALVHRPDDTPFELNEAKARRGAERFVAHGCVRCHTTGDPAVDGATPPALEAAPLAGLAGHGRPAACLAPTGRIRFEREGDRDAVWAALADVSALEQPLDAHTAVAHTLDRFNCYACHRRDDLGGTHPKVRDYFLADESAELGDEGRIPPHLSQVGAKLRRHWLQEVLLRDGRARPYMHTRMPRFGVDNIGHLVDLFPAADPPAPERSDWDVSPDVLKLGHELVGKGALGCIDCHTFGGQRSLGVQAVDLTTMVDRIHYGWFEELMLDPKSLNMDTRMPSFWTDGESPVDLLDRDPKRQIEAVWAFLSLGDGMATPKGLSTSGNEYELVPTDEPITCGVFMRDVSPRTLVVGFPERAHYAYDMQGARLARLWRGRFFNARGTWEGRAGQLEAPPSNDVLTLPPGPAFARLADAAEPWPTEGLTPLGRSFDAARVPILRSGLGPVTIEERLVPELRFGGSVMHRHVTVRADRPVRDLWFRPFAWSSGGEAWARPERGDDGTLRYAEMDPPVELSFDGLPTPTPIVGTGVDLVVPVRLERVGSHYEASFSVEVSW